MPAAPGQVLTRPKDLACMVEEWRTLAAGVPGTSYFLSPDWVLGWWESLGEGLRVEVAVWRGAQDRLEAVVPLAWVEEPLDRRLPIGVGLWTNLGSGPGSADHCGWAVMGHRVADARAWVEQMAAEAPMLLRNLDPLAGVALIPRGARQVAVSACPRLELPAPDAEPTPLRKSLKRIRSYSRRLAAQGVRFRLVAGDQVTDALLGEVYRLHQRRRSMLGGRTSFHPGQAGLHRQLIARAGPKHGPAIVLAECDGRPIGALYGFRWDEQFAYYQLGWEPEWATSHLGTVVVNEAIRLVASDGVRMFDFLRGTETYKYRFGAADRVDETWLLPHGGRGRLLDLRYRIKTARAQLAAR